MNRRHFLLAGGALLGTALVGGAVRQALQPPADLAGLLVALEAMRQRPLATVAGWSPFTVFSHLAQSVEYSLPGYPALKPAWFRQTAGPAAFWTFAAAGAMRHSLTEPIPGAPALAESGDVQAALTRLQQALATFAAHEGALAPHFAYGTLSKEDYALAHVMHVRDHLRLFDAASLGG
jgi:hypothetical protein